MNLFCHSLYLSITKKYENKSRNLSNCGNQNWDRYEAGLARQLLKVLCVSIAPLTEISSTTTDVITQWIGKSKNEYLKSGKYKILLNSK